MLVASFFAHVGLGLVLSIIFVICYLSGDGKRKIIFEVLIGVGGNIGSIFLLDTLLPADNNQIRLISISACLFSFIIGTVVSLIVSAKIIEGKDRQFKIKMRDIFLGQYAYINHYYESRKREIDEHLDIENLIKREECIKKKEEEIAQIEETINADRKYIDSELTKINELGKKKVKIPLPMDKKIVLNEEFIAIIPSYIRDIFDCISAINAGTKDFINKSNKSIDVNSFMSYCFYIATCISNNLFGGNSKDVRVHFRVYDKQKKSYVKFIAVLGKSIYDHEMTMIPYDDDSLIKRSYENRTALIKSINCPHNYQSRNHKIWEDYITYTFTDLLYEDKPFLAFGVSVKNAERYRKWLYLINYFGFERYLQENFESVNKYVNISNILYGGNSNV